QHRLQIEGGLADDLEHVTCRGLIFERLLQVARAAAQFVEQPRILHRDDRLRREVLQQRDLLVGERPYVLAVYRDRGEQVGVFSQSNRDEGAGFAEFGERTNRREVRSVRLVCRDVDRLGNAAPVGELRQRGSRRGSKTLLRQKRGVIRRTSTQRHGLKAFAVISP